MGKTFVIGGTVESPFLDRVEQNGFGPQKAMGILQTEFSKGGFAENAMDVTRAGVAFGAKPKGLEV